MDWPRRLVIERHRKSYINLFELDADDSSKILHDNCKMSINLQDQIIIRGEGEEEDSIVCRKSYLVQNSEYFRSFVERWSKDKTGSTPEIKLENISLDVFRTLVELASTGFIEMGAHSDLPTLIGAANFLEMANLTSRFSALIRHEMKRYNSSVILWSYLTPEEYHGYVGLSKRASAIVKAKFEIMIATCSEQLMEMSGKQWLDLVSDPDLFVVSEDVLFRTLSRWVAVDHSTRSDDFVGMAKYIRGGCLSEGLLAEYRDGTSIPSVVRKFVAGISESSEHQPRTVEVAAYFKYDVNKGILCFHPLARSAGSVWLSTKFDSYAYWYFALSVPSTNIIYTFSANSICAIDPVIDKWIPKIASIPSGFDGGCERPTTYLDEFVYMAFPSNDHEGFGIFRASCSDSDFSNRGHLGKLQQLDVPYHIRSNVDPLLVGFNGKLYIFNTNRFCPNSFATYDPSKVSTSDAWSAILQVTPPFEKLPDSSCVGPDGMLYLKGKTRLWIFNPATSEFRISAECPETLVQVFNMEKKIVCLAKPEEESKLATWVYDHVADLWIERYQTTIDVDEDGCGKYLPIRLLASSFNPTPRKTAKRPLEN